MKFFTLFNKSEELHVPDNSKVVDKEAYSKLIDLESLVTKTKQDAEKYLEDIRKQGEEIKQKAHEEGFQEGLEKFNKAILKIEKEIRSLRDEFNKKILPVALKAAKKILGEELKLHPDRITDIVIQALKPVTQHHHIKIYVNKQDLATLERDKPQIKKILEQVETFVLQERNDVEPGGCIIETEEGIINAQLENQWRALEAAFKTFMKP